MNAANLELNCFALASKSSRSKYPSEVVFTGTTFNPAMMADCREDRLRSLCIEIRTYGGVRTMCAQGNEANISGTITLGQVILVDYG